MKTAGTICGIGIWVALMWPVLQGLEWNPWMAPFTGLVVAGGYLLVTSIAVRLATIAGAVDVKSRAERRLASEPDDVDAWVKKALLEQAQDQATGAKPAAN